MMLTAGIGLRLEARNVLRDGAREQLHVLRQIADMLTRGDALAHYQKRWRSCSASRRRDAARATERLDRACPADDRSLAEKCAR
jgi:hypothetical protein